MWGVDVLAAGVEGTSCGKLGEAACTVVHLWASAGEGRGGGAGVEVAQSRGGRQQAHRPHCPGIAAVAMVKTIRHTMRGGHRNTTQRHNINTILPQQEAFLLPFV